MGVGPYLPSGPVVRLEHRDPHAALPEPVRRDEPADAGADDGDRPGGRGARVVGGGHGEHGAGPAPARGGGAARTGAGVG